MDHVVILLCFCALGSGVGFCGNTVLVMIQYFRGDASSILHIVPNAGLPFVGLLLCIVSMDLFELRRRELKCDEK